MPTKIIELIGFLIVLFGELVYAEVIICKFLGLDENTKKEIEKRDSIERLNYNSLAEINNKDGEEEEEENDDRQFFFEYKKYILLYGVIDVSDINDEDSLNTIIKNSRLKSSFHWYKFLRVLGLYYANKYYYEVLNKVKQYVYPIYEQV